MDPLISIFSHVAMLSTRIQSGSFFSRRGESEERDQFLGEKSFFIKYANDWNGNRKRREKAMNLHFPAPQRAQKYIWLSNKDDGLDRKAHSSLSLSLSD